MATTSNESLSELERRAESTRAELAQTVDALHARVSPGALKADVRNYVRDNPLQAAALAVGVAYPVWRMIGAMPAPVLLIGAGLALSQRGSRNGGMAPAPGNGGMMSSLKEKASDFGAQVSEKAQQTIESVRSMASEKIASATEAVSETYHSSRDTASGTMQQLSEQMSDTYVRTRETLSDAIDRHPFMVGGAAFVIGSLVAAAVPVTRQESRMLGETAEEFRRRTGDLALHGMHEAQRAARRVYQTAAEEVRQQGLTPEVARHAARTAVESARDAVEETATGTGQGRLDPSSRNPAS